MDKELIEKLLKVFNEYEQWRKDTNSLMTLTLCALPQTHLKPMKTTMLKVVYKGSDYFRNYDIVFVDEAQD